VHFLDKGNKILLTLTPILWTANLDAHVKGPFCYEAVNLDMQAHFLFCLILTKPQEDAKFARKIKGSEKI